MPAVAKAALPQQRLKFDKSACEIIHPEMMHTEGLHARGVDQVAVIVEVMKSGVRWCCGWCCC